jgi:hypothetical protein
VSGRIRTLKPEWLEDALIARQPEYVRVLSVALILMADDYGRARAEVEYVAGEAWRYHRDGAEQRARDGLAALERIRFIRLYEVDGQRYLEIRNWSKHQRVSHPGKPRIPPPPEGLENPPEDLARVSRDSREHGHAVQVGETVNGADPPEDLARPSGDPRRISCLITDHRSPDHRAPRARAPTRECAHDARAHARAREDADPVDPGATPSGAPQDAPATPPTREWARPSPEPATGPPEAPAIAALRTTLSHFGPLTAVLAPSMVETLAADAFARGLRADDMRDGLDWASRKVAAATGAGNPPTAERALELALAGFANAKKFGQARRFSRPDQPAGSQAAARKSAPMLRADLAPTPEEEAALAADEAAHA